MYFVLHIQNSPKNSCLTRHLHVHLQLSKTQAWVVRSPHVFYDISRGYHGDAKCLLALRSAAGTELSSTAVSSISPQIWTGTESSISVLAGTPHPPNCGSTVVPHTASCLGCGPKSTRLVPMQAIIPVARCSVSRFAEFLIAASKENPNFARSSETAIHLSACNHAPAAAAVC